MNKIRVVFVDDEVSICKLIPHFFKENYIEIVTYSCPATAIEECSKCVPDLLFTDYNMPHINGEQLALRMPKEVPIHLISGHVSEQGSMSYNFISILTKPFNFAEIKAVINARYEELKKAA